MEILIESQDIENPIIQYEKAFVSEAKQKL